jgi:hypothetical protein
MARSWQYGRWRRILMQVVMWVILAATVGLAALVTSHRSKSGHANLVQISTKGRVTLRMPAGWLIGGGSEPGTLLVAQEPGAGNGGEGRMLTVRWQRVRGVSSAQEFLVNHGFLRGAITIDESGDGGNGDDDTDAGPQPAPAETTAMKPVSIGGWAGVMATVYRPQASPMSIMPMLRKQVIAAVLLPSRQALVLQLDSRAPMGEGIAPDALDADADLMRRIAAGVSIKGEPTPVKQATVTLNNGLTLHVPPEYSVVPQTDPNRTDLGLFLDRAGDAGSRSRLGIQLVPCVHFANDSSESVRSMLMLYNPALATAAAISRNDDGFWRVQWPVNANGGGGGGGGGDAAAAATDAQSISGARLIDHGDGNAVMLLFSGAPADSTVFAHAYDVLSKDVATDAGSIRDCGAMLKAGGDEAQRIANVGLAKLLDEHTAPADQWWVIRDGGGAGDEESSGAAAMVLGWVHQFRDQTVDTGGFGMQRETRWRLDKLGIKVIETWSADASLSGYRYEMNRRDMELGGAAGTDGASGTGGGDTSVVHSHPSYFQRTLLHDGKLQFRTGYGNTQGGGVLSPSTAAPPAYMPGGWLGLLVGKLSPTVPMILQADSFVGLSGKGVAVAQPMRLIFTPGGPPKSTEGGEALRCVTVEVSGTGLLSRFYFKADGSLDSIDYSDGLQQAVSNEADVKFQFRGDARMEP